MGNRYLSALDRFLGRIDWQQGGCWIWMGKRSIGGYGRFKVNSREITVHRWAYEYWRGPFPAGLVTDHLCRVRACVNPWHLEAVTQSVNRRRGDLPQTWRTHCPRAHPYDAQNTYVFRGKRRCRACARAYQQQRRDREKNRLRA